MALNLVNVNIVVSMLHENKYTVASSSVKQ